MKVVELVECEIEGSPFLALIANPQSGYKRARVVGRYQRDNMHLAIGPSSHVPLRLVGLLQDRNAVDFTDQIEAVIELTPGGTILYRTRFSEPKLPDLSSVWTLLAKALLERLREHA